MEDRQIIELYWERSELAIAETERKYGRYCHYIAYQILFDEEDAKEIVNDTYLKAWSTIPPNRPDSLKAYLGVISSRLALNRYEGQTAKKRGGGQLPLVLEELSECVSGKEDGAAFADRIALQDALNRFLYTLPRKTRNIFVRRYWYVSTINEIAAEYGMKESAVTVQLLRTRKKLKEFLKKEGFDV